MLRGVRGATTADENNKTAIMAAVQELLAKLAAANDIKRDDIGAVIFSTTPDLDAAFPAAGARALGWGEVPLFGTQEIEVASAPKLCIRVLILWNTERAQQDIKHIYLKGSQILRPDLAGSNSSSEFTEREGNT